MAGVGLDPDNKIDREQQERYNPVSSDLYKQEQAGYDREFNDIANNFGDTADAGQENANIDKVRSAEENPNSPSWTTNVTGAKQAIKGKISSQKKKLIGGAVALVLGGGGILGGGYLTLSALPFHVLENVVGRFDTQNTSFTIRSNRVLVNKLTNQATSGSCDTVKIACRFSRPSGDLLEKMSDNDIIAKDAKGNTIEAKKGIWPSERPATYEFTDSTGKKASIAARDMGSALSTNTEFRAAFHQAFNPRWVTWTDSAAMAVYKRFNVSKRNTLAESTSESDVKKTLTEASRGESADVKNMTAEEGESMVSKLLKEKFATVLDKLAKSGKGGGTQMVGGAACMLADTPRLVTSVARDYQMAKLVAYTVPLMAGISAAKAGDGTTPEMAGIGTLLATSVNGKSAMDSDGMHYALFGDTKPTSAGYKKFIPGASVLASTGNSVKILSSDAVRQTCSTISSPVTGAAINMALVANSGETLGVSAGIALLNFAIGTAAAVFIEKATPFIVDTLTPLLLPAAQAILEASLGDLTKDIAGADVGDAFVAGSSNFMGHVASQGGNIPLTVDQAVEYSKLSQGVQVAYAEEDRATHSPLDPTTSSTFVGSIVGKIAPHVGQMSSLTGMASGLASITASSLNPLSTAKAANFDPEQYRQCTDPTIQQADVAAGMFCNVWRGIPADWINADPSEVLQYMLDNKQIDENSGDALPDSEYESFSEFCKDGSVDEVASCMAAGSDNENIKKIAMYSLWTVDHRVTNIADGTDTVTTEATPSTGTTSGSATGDDYPYKTSPVGQASPLTYYYRECVDFVAWRLNKQSGITQAPFQFGGFGNAIEWRQNAISRKYPVDKTPAVGAVAWWGANVTAAGFTSGGLGHVAIVSEKKSDGSIVVEQYNGEGAPNDHKYGTLTIPASDVKNLDFLHIADIKGEV